MGEEWREGNITCLGEGRWVDGSSGWRKGRREGPALRRKGERLLKWPLLYTCGSRQE